MGLVWTLHSAGAAASSQLGAYAAQSFHSYTQVSLVEAIAVFVSLLLVVQLPVAGGEDDEPGLRMDPATLSRPATPAT